MKYGGGGVIAADAGDELREDMWWTAGPECVSNILSTITTGMPHAQRRATVRACDACFRPNACMPSTPLHCH
jgi:hypothetical protein